MSNQAAWLTAAKAKPLKVDSAPTPKAGAGEVVIKNEYVAINPADWKVQDYDFAVKEYPTILGMDVAGEIVEVGEGVTRFHKGQKVIGHALGLATGNPKNSGFQLYAVLSEIVVAALPPSVSTSQGVVLPLSLSTAAAGLFQTDALALPYPTKDAKPTNTAILVWGGSSSVGSSAVQLAAASGITVISTASAKNIDYVKGLGATHVFDHSSEGVVSHIVDAIKSSGSTFVGVYDAISSESTTKAGVEILSQLGGGKIITVLPAPTDLPENVKAISIIATSVATTHKEVGDAVWRKFVPEALADGRLKAAPDALIIKGGLASVQEGLDLLKKGVSAQKVVIEL